MLSQSVHSKLSRVRKPRVHITYDVETEGAVVQKELPFVVGVIGDFSGKPTSPLPSLRDRKFVQIDRDNFNEVMSRMRPALNLKVENTLKDDGTEISVDLQFSQMDDFEPGAIAKQVPALQKLLDVRGKLQDLLTKADRSERLEELLEQILKNEGELKELAADLEPAEPPATQTAAAVAPDAGKPAKPTKSDSGKPAAPTEPTSDDKETKS